MSCYNKTARLLSEVWNLSNIYNEEEDEVIVYLRYGYTVRSGAEDNLSGDYVRICDPEGEELVYWDYVEWEQDPQLVIGAFINLMATASLGNLRTSLTEED